MEKYIVNVDKDISPPSYLNKNCDYKIPNGLSEADRKANISVNIMNDEHWPLCEELQFDCSQYDAFRAALTKQLVVIQGPPGDLNFSIQIFSIIIQFSLLYHIKLYNFCLF